MAEGALPAVFCTIVAGPNGSGKSTIYPLLAPIGEFINADVEARRLDPSNPEAVSMAAGRVVLIAINDAVESRRSFVYETTLSSRQSIAVMERCKNLGYEVSLVYVALDSPDMNVQRIAERVSRGGHNIPEDVVRRRYETAFGRLPSALKLADSVLVFDNSRLSPEMLLTLERGEIIENHLDEANGLHVRLAEAVGHALDLDFQTVLHSARYT